MPVEGDGPPIDKLANLVNLEQASECSNLAVCRRILISAQRSHSV